MSGDCGRPGCFECNPFVPPPYRVFTGGQTPLVRPLTEVLAAHRPYGLDCKCGRPINSDNDWAVHVASEIGDAS